MKILSKYLYKSNLFIMTLIFFIVLFLLISNMKQSLSITSKSEPKISVTYNVTDFGANGKDKKLDTIAIQNVLSKAKETSKLIEVYVPAGRYYIDSTLNIFSDTILTLDENAIIESADEDKQIGMLKASHLNENGNICSNSDCNHGGYSQWKNITIQGGKWIFNHDGSSNYSGFKMIHGQNLIIRNTTLKEYAGNGLNISASKEILVDKVIFKDQISAEPTKSDTKNESLHLDAATETGEKGQYPEDGTPVYDVTITNSTFKDVSSGIGAHVAFTKEENYGNKITIKNNKFKNVRRFAMNLFAFKNVEISDNIATGADGAYGFVRTWFTSANIHDNDVSNFESTIIKVVDSRNKYKLTLDKKTASHVKNQYYYIQYKPNGGKGTMNSSRIEYGDSKKIAKNKFTKYGYKFIGWSAYRKQISNLGWYVKNDNKFSWKTEEQIKESGYTLAILFDEYKIKNMCNDHRATLVLYAQWTPIKKINISTKPTKIKYVQNKETLDLTGGVLTATYDNGSTENIKLTDSRVKISNFDNTKLGKNTITIKYNGSTTSLNVEIIQKNLDNIKIKTYPTKKKYIQNKETLDLTGGILTLTYNDNSASTLSLNNKNIIVTGFDNSKLGKNKLTVKYKKFTTTFEVEIVPKTLVKIELKNYPTKVNYIKNSEKLDLTGGILKATYNDKSIDTINLNDKNVTVTGFDNSKLGKNKITIKFEDAITTFNVEIISKKLIKIELTTLPIKTNYLQNQEVLDLTGGILKLVYNDKSTDTLNLNNKNVTVTGFNNSKLGKNKITIKYKELTTTFDVKIISKKIVKIELTTLPTKINYLQNQETLDLTGGILKVTYGDKSTDKISLSNKSVTVTEFNNSKLGKNTLTAKYKGVTTNFDVEIILKQLVKIELATLPTKIKYIQNQETLDLTGGILKLIYNDKSTYILNLNDKNITVTGFDNSKLGKNILTIKYKDFTTTFDVQIIQKKIIQEQNKIKLTINIIIGVLLITISMALIIIRKKRKFKSI